MNDDTRIDIDAISDNIKYQEIAKIVDSQTFLECLRIVRSILKVDGTLSVDEAVLYYSEQLHIPFPQANIPTELAGIKAKNLIDACLRYVYDKCKIGNLYESALITAILTGKITDEVTRDNVSIHIITEEDGLKFWGNDEKLIIDVGKAASVGEVVAKVKKELPQKLAELSPIEYKPYDVRGNIRRDRHWYWLHKGGNSYKKILESLPQSHRPTERDAIRLSIKRYEKLITS